MVTIAPGRKIVPLLPREGAVVYGGVRSYPEDPSRPTYEVTPATKALAIRQNDGVVHIYPIDEGHYLYDRPSGQLI